MECNSQRLRALQRIVETACTEMEQSLVMHKPGMRHEIARMVFNLADCELTNNEILTTVVESMDRQRGRAKHVAPPKAF